MKCTKCGTDMVKSFIKPEWEQQLNINAAIYRANDFPVERLRIFAILRDHMKSKALADADYPKIPFQEVELPLWSMDTALEFIGYRMSLHEAAKLAPDDKLMHCTDAERWTRPTTWAVMKQGNKTATRVFDTQAEAIIFMEGHKDAVKMNVVERKGESVRCYQGYCKAFNWCAQCAKEKEDDNS